MGDDDTSAKFLRGTEYLRGRPRGRPVGAGLAFRSLSGFGGRPRPRLTTGDAFLSAATGAGDAERSRLRADDDGATGDASVLRGRPGPRFGVPSCAFAATGSAAFFVVDASLRGRPRPRFGVASLATCLIVSVADTNKRTHTQTHVQSVFSP